MEQGPTTTTSLESLPSKILINSFRLDKTVFLALLLRGKVSLSAFGEGNFSLATTFMLCILHSHENYHIDLEAQFDYGLGDKFWRTSHFKKRKVRF